MRCHRVRSVGPSLCRRGRGVHARPPDGGLLMVAARSPSTSQAFCKPFWRYVGNTVRLAYASFWPDSPGHRWGILCRAGRGGLANFVFITIALPVARCAPSLILL